VFAKVFIKRLIIHGWRRNHILEFTDTSAALTIGTDFGTIGNR